MKYTIEFFRDFFYTFGKMLSEAIYILLAIINHIIKIGIKGLIGFYNSILVPLIQQTIEMVGHVSVSLYREMLFFSSITFMGIADFSIWMSRISQQKAKEIQEKYRWF